jgi:tyrosine type site-specific recombinase
MTIRVTTIGKYERPDGTVPIYISFAGHGKTAFHGLGVYVLPSEFDKETGTVRTVDRRRKADFARYNLLIQAELTRARNLLLSLQLAGKAGSILPARFKALFAAGETDGEGGTFTGFFRSFIERKTGRTREIYQNTLDKIVRLHGEEVPFDAVNHAWLEAFDRSMRTSDICNGRGEVLRTGLTTNARAIHLRNIRAVFNKAIDEEVIGLELYPFRRFKIEKERTRKRAVSLTQLRALFDYPCETAAEEWAVDVSRLIFYLIGINTVDLFNLEEYDGGYIHYRRAKTGTLYSIKVEPEAAALLEKYRGREHLLNFRERFKHLESFKAKINKTLKVIASKDPRIPVMTSYTFRHTWATLAAELDIPKETIAAGLGHAQNATVTDVYIDFNRKKVDAANRRVLDYVAGGE